MKKILWKRVYINGAHLLTENAFVNGYVLHKIKVVFKGGIDQSPYYINTKHKHAPKYTSTQDLPKSKCGISFWKIIFLHLVSVWVCLILIQFSDKIMNKNCCFNCVHIYSGKKWDMQNSVLNLENRDPMN